MDASLNRLMEETCAACHTLDRVRSRKLGRDGWQTIVADMREKGARLNDTNSDLLVDFLARTFGQ